MKRIRLGYVGCGFMAQKVHIPNLSSIPGCELVALADIHSMDLVVEAAFLQHDVELVAIGRGPAIGVDHGFGGPVGRGGKGWARS